MAAPPHESDGRVRALDLPGFYARCEARFRACVAGVADGPDRAALLQYRMAPFASDPELSFRQNPLFVVSMKPYGQPGRAYPFGWDERADRPGLHRWLDAERRTSNFTREATRLLDVTREVLGIALPGSAIPNTYASFFRAEDAAQLKRWGLARVDCADLLTELLAVVRPEYVLCIGNGPAPSAFATIARAFGTTVDAARRMPVAPRTFVKALEVVGPWGARPVRVVGVPHLSYVRADALTSALTKALTGDTKKFGAG